MDRRNFIKNSSLAGIAWSSLVLGSCNPSRSTDEDQKSKEENKGLDPSLPDLHEATVTTLLEMMSQGKYTARKITEYYLQRIAGIDKAGPRLNAVIELNPDALAIADQLDQERKAGKVRPLHGIPVLIKDNIDTGDAMQTTAGSLALEGHKAKQDASVVKQLREAGAILLGKTNLSEWANFRSTRSVSGWSSRGGQTKNPHVLDRNPCGSSSGSAAAVAADLCAVAIGTETDGSITAPSSFCGIVGIKPTVGLISRSGIIPISSTQDTAGPMARTVRDAAILLGLLTAEDPEDETTRAENRKVSKDYTSFLDATALKGKRIGIEQSFLEGHEGVVGVYKGAIELMKAQGATIVEVNLMTKIKPLLTSEFILMQFEFKDGLNRYLEKSGGKIKSLQDVIAFNKMNEKQAMPYFKQELLEQSELRGDLKSSEYQSAKSHTLSSRKMIDELMAQHHLDVFAGTTIGLPGMIDPLNGDYDTGFYFCQPAAMAGYPHVTVPMGSVSHLPLGLSLLAGAFEEPKLIAIAYAFEQASRARITPQFIPSLNKV